MGGSPREIVPRQRIRQCSRRLIWYRWWFRGKGRVDAQEIDSISSAKSLFPVPWGQACWVSSLSRVLGECFFYGACMKSFCNDNNLTPSFCRCTTVTRLLPTGRLGCQWFSRHQGDSSRLRWWKMWKLPRLWGATGGIAMVMWAVAQTAKETDLDGKRVVLQS